MPALLLKILAWVVSGAIAKVLLSTGFGIGTAIYIKQLTDQYIQRAITNLSATADIAGLMALSGMDVALSIVIGAITIRATIAALGLTFFKS